jgi:beta-galactosidase
MMHYSFNYAPTPGTIKYPYRDGKELLMNEAVTKDKMLQLEPWGVKIVEEQ